jgi:excisionase family DNA binding protein
MILYDSGAIMEKEQNNTLDLFEIMTVREVASYLHLSQATVYQMARTGQIPVARIGRNWRFTKDSIIKWISNSTEKQKIL